jgi:hypothetical protein
VLTSDGRGTRFEKRKEGRRGREHNLTERFGPFWRQAARTLRALPALPVAQAPGPCALVFLLAAVRHGCRQQQCKHEQCRRVSPANRVRVPRRHALAHSQEASAARELHRLWTLLQTRRKKILIQPIPGDMRLQISIGMPNFGMPNFDFRNSALTNFDFAEFRFPKFVNESKFGIDEFRKSKFGIPKFGIPVESKFGIPKFGNKRLSSKTRIGRETERRREQEGIISKRVLLNSFQIRYVPPGILYSTQILFVMFRNPSHFPYVRFRGTKNGCLFHGAPGAHRFVSKWIHFE